MPWRTLENVKKLTLYSCRIHEVCNYELIAETNCNLQIQSPEIVAYEILYKNILAHMKIPVLAIQARIIFIIGASICFPLLRILWGSARDTCKNLSLLNTTGPWQRRLAMPSRPHCRSRRSSCRASVPKCAAPSVVLDSAS